MLQQRWHLSPGYVSVTVSRVCKESCEKFTSSGMSLYHGYFHLNTYYDNAADFDEVKRECMRNNSLRFATL